jgi:Protein of unknown function (DUF2490)
MPHGWHHLCTFEHVLKLRVTGLILLAFCSLDSTTLMGQTPDIGWEERPKITAITELLPRTRIEIWGELQHGSNFSFQRWRGGGLLERRMKPIVKAQGIYIDVNNEHYLVFAGGYEYLHTVQDGSKRIENRVIAQVTPRLLVGRVLLSDRNRTEFRWVNGAYDFRYRNKVVILGRLQRGTFKLRPYASGELYYDRNHHSWNENRYGFGVQFPYKKRWMLDTYLLHQNCTTCSPTSVNMIGVTLNLYFRQKH